MLYTGCCVGLGAWLTQSSSDYTVVKSNQYIDICTLDCGNVLSLLSPPETRSAGFRNIVRRVRWACTYDKRACEYSCQVNQNILRLAEAREERPGAAMCKLSWPHRLLDTAEPVCFAWPYEWNYYVTFALGLARQL